MKRSVLGFVVVALSMVSLPALADPKAGPSPSANRSVVVRYVVGNDVHRQEIRADQIPANANGIRIGVKHYAIASNGITNVMSTGKRPVWTQTTRSEGTKTLGSLPALKK